MCSSQWQTKRMEALTKLQMLQNLDELESDGGSDSELEINVADEEFSDSDVDFKPPMPEPVRQESGRDGTVRQKSGSDLTVRQDSGSDGTMRKESGSCL